MKQDDVVKALQRDHAAELKLAASRLDGTARHTRIMPSPTLSEATGYKILLKPENLQVTGSFKIRGAYNKIASLSDEELARGIITASAGNHAQGVAYASRERGAKATIVMPESTPPLKVDATKSYGANVVLHGSLFDEAAAYASELSQRDGMIYVPPFDDYEVLCGQGTIGLEILEDVPDVTDVVVPLGGGGWAQVWRSPSKPSSLRSRSLARFRKVPPHLRIRSRQDHWFRLIKWSPRPKAWRSPTPEISLLQS